MTVTLQKVKNLEELKKIREIAREKGQKVVLANGCFDMFHSGHISYLEESKQKGDILIVAVNSDDSIISLKGPKRPIFPLEERLEILNAFEAVDYLIVFDENTCEKLLRELRPDVHSKGTDYTVETVPERNVAIELGIETYIAGEPKENASKDIIMTVLKKNARK